MTSKLSRIHMVSDFILVKATNDEIRESGIIIPALAKEKSLIRTGFVIKVGPGTPIPDFKEAELEDWKKKSDEYGAFIPLQTKIGDCVYYYRPNVLEVEIDDDIYHIIKEIDVMMLDRDENLI